MVKIARKSESGGDIELNIATGESNIPEIKEEQIIQKRRGPKPKLKIIQDENVVKDIIVETKQKSKSKKDKENVVNFGKKYLHSSYEDLKMNKVYNDRLRRSQFKNENVKKYLDWLDNQK